MWGLGFSVLGLECRVRGLGFRALGKLPLSPGQVLTN